MSLDQIATFSKRSLSRTHLSIGFAKIHTHHMNKKCTKLSRDEYDALMYMVYACFQDDETKPPLPMIWRFIKRSGIIHIDNLNAVEMENMDEDIRSIPRTFKTKESCEHVLGRLLRNTLASDILVYPYHQRRLRAALRRKRAGYIPPHRRHYGMVVPEWKWMTPTEDIALQRAILSRIEHYVEFLPSLRRKLRENKLLKTLHRKTH